MVCATGLLAVFTPHAAAQGSRADYERSAGLGRSLSNKVFRDRVEPRWLPGNTRFWYEVKTGANTREYVLVDAEAGTRQPAFDHDRLAETLRRAGTADARGDRLALTDLDWPDARTLAFTHARLRWRIALTSYEVLEKSVPPSAPSTALAPEDAPKGSTNSGRETSLLFKNSTADAVDILWVDREGVARSYHPLKAGESYEQPTYAGHVWLAQDATGARLAAFVAKDQPGEAEITGRIPARGSRPTSSRSRVGDNRTSPDGRWRASIKESNVVLTEVATGQEFALSSDGRANEAYRSRVFWSRDSAHLVAARVEAGEEHKVSFVESSPKDKVQPTLHTFDYYKPGDKLPHPHPVLWEVATRRRIPIDEALFPQPYTTTGNLDITWAQDSSCFRFDYNQRGHQVHRTIAVDATTGAARALVEERTETFIDHTGNKRYQELSDAVGEIVSASERDGWNHLYLHDAKTGAIKNQITHGEWLVRQVDKVDWDKRQIWFQAGGLVPGQDPYQVHYARVNFDGTGLVVLTEGDGTHALTFSPDRRFALDRYSRVDLPAITTLRRMDDGRHVCDLENGDARALYKTGWRAPERFVAKGRDGTTDIYGIIVRPTNFDPAKRYPVLEKIYAGPHGAAVPKSFGTQSDTLEMAELGFIVVQIDGMGTNLRSKAFHDVCWKNIADAGLPDRVLWIKAAAAKHPEMDLARVGIYGTSAGGQNALGALLTHGDFYRAGVADCGCHDNRMDKIWWNEQWMGWPVGPHYAEQSNVTLAPKLQGKLLLMVGEMDRNVDPASTMQVADALIKANQDFELLVMPGVGHGVRATPYGKRRAADFFVRHLLGREPRWE